MMMLQRPTLSFITASLIALLATTDTAHSFSVPRMATTMTATVHSPSLSVPRIIQGGMGIRISSWELARAVSRKGELGVISGTGIDTILVRILQKGMYRTPQSDSLFNATQLTIFHFSTITNGRTNTGDPTGEMRRALASFPDQDMVERLLDKYFIEGGKDPNKPFRSVPMWTVEPSQALLEATVIANYCEVWLAKHDDDNTPTGGLVGINRLTKVQLPTLASLYGAMLADVDYVIMGAGIPLKIPGVLDKLSEGMDVTFPIDITGSVETHSIQFSPNHFWSAAGKPSLAEQKLKLKRPAFVPIVSSVVLAKSMLKRADGKGPTKGIQGFVVELPTAGGHNAPPRGFRYDPVAKTHAVDLNDKGEPIYGPKDEVDLLKFLQASHGLPFWMAGSYAHPDKFSEVVKMGAQGVQCGTLFALADESGMDKDTRQEILSAIAEKDLSVFTDPVASPTGYPFKVLKLDNTLSNDDNYEARPRLCSLGYLRTPYIDDDGKIGYRCPAEPVEDWVKKGGEIEATKGRKCLCNALCANVGFPQTRAVKADTGDKMIYVEGKLITIGDEVNNCRRFMKQDETGRWGYSAAEVVDYLKSEWNESLLRNEIQSAVFGTEDNVDAPQANS
jgi:NAD(P)H-dependent flavin oxidoreductase YrpB (nitropropane dioxygenase family)